VTDTPPPACDLPGLHPADYAAWRDTSLGAITEALERRLILDLLGDVRGKRVLDVGCGDGDLAVALAGRGATVVGLDPSTAMLAAARERAERAAQPVSFVSGVAEALPFAPGNFDIVVAVTILCFVADGAPAFAEAARVMRPGGAFVIGELGRWSSWAALRRIRAWLGSPLWREGHFRTPGELRGLAAGAGLQPGPVRGAIYFPRSAAVARHLARHDAALSRRLGGFGAAFLALRATRPENDAKRRTDAGGGVPHEAGTFRPVGGNPGPSGAGTTRAFAS
jgi:SAM-dependent methyltransferase